MLIETDVPLNLFDLDHSRKREVCFRQKWVDITWLENLSKNCGKYDNKI